MKKLSFLSLALIITLSIPGILFTSCASPDKAGNNKIQTNKDNDTQALDLTINFIVEYNVNISGFKGLLTLKNKDGVLSGTILFYHLEDGVPEPLKNLSLKNNVFFFIRSITNNEELKKYKGKRFFKQEYRGKISPDGSFIKGYYIQSGIETGWKAIRK